MRIRHGGFDEYFDLSPFLKQLTFAMKNYPPYSVHIIALTASYVYIVCYILSHVPVITKLVKTVTVGQYEIRCLQLDT